MHGSSTSDSSKEHKQMQQEASFEIPETSTFTHLVTSLKLREAVDARSAAALNKMRRGKSGTLDAAPGASTSCQLRLVADPTAGRSTWTSEHGMSLNTVCHCMAAKTCFARRHIAGIGRTCIYSMNRPNLSPKTGLAILLMHCVQVIHILRHSPCDQKCASAVTVQCGLSRTC
jgi:hypothetical protein